MEEYEDIQQYINREISLRSENMELKKELSYLKERVKILKEDKSTLKLKTEKYSADEKLAIQLREKIEKLQSELIDYKQRSYKLIETHKNLLDTVSSDIENLTTENERLKKQVRDKEEELTIITVKYTKMMNTKIMKWTGKYWNLLKKIN